LRKETNLPVLLALYQTIAVPTFEDKGYPLFLSISQGSFLTS